MGLKEHILQVLKSNETRRINFSFMGDDGRTIQIDYTAFQKVITAIEGGKITFGDAATLPSGSDGGYTSDGNSFTIRPAMTWSRLFNALIVHESVHAYFDITSMRLLGIDSEAAGYIAQGYYLHNSGFTRDIPDDLVSVGRRCINTRATGHINSDDLTRLRSNIENDSRYASILFRNPASSDLFNASNRKYFQGNGV
ncbi:hypothetical protein [Runella sp.]|jgi:hypothetical protein|uniref:hypothetical protein n=1 Tax=Runella sp. TaxID=1960881 RepID=UPI00260A624B|nr:hypothetical protein [Runella sp.]